MYPSANHHFQYFYFHLLHAINSEIPTAFSRAKYLHFAEHKQIEYLFIMSSYTEIDIQNDIEDIEGGMSARKAAINNDVPRSTLFAHTHGRKLKLMKIGKGFLKCRKSTSVTRFFCSGSLRCL